MPRPLISNTVSSSAPRRSGFVRYSWLFLSLILLGSGILRFLMCFDLWSSKSSAVCNPSVQTDMATYLRLSKEICSGHWLDHFDYQPFYYTVFLPICRFFSGDSPWGYMALQIAAGVAAVYFCWLTASRLFGRKAGLAAALLLALDRIHIFYTPFALLEILQSFWLILILYTTCRCWKENKKWLWGADALLISIATLTRGNAILLLPGFLALLFYRNRSNRKLAWMLLAASLIIFEIPQLPYSIQNFRYTGRWCGASTAGDKVLALGNTPEAPPGGLEYPLTYHKWCELSDRNPSEGRISVKHQILQWFFTDPVTYFELKFRALLLFWDRREIPNNVNMQVEWARSDTLRLPILLGFIFIGSFALAGLVQMLRRVGLEPLSSPCHHTIYYLIVLYMVCASWFGTALFYNLARFRLSALPLLCVAGGNGWKFLVDAYAYIRTLKEKKAKRQARQALILWGLCCIFVVSSAYSVYQSYLEPWFMRTFRPYGLHVIFPEETTLIYDHGPLSFGGVGYYAIPQGGQTLQKRLFVGTSYLPGEAQVRLAVTCTEATRISGYLEHNGKRIPLSNANLKQDRFLYWLEVTLPEIVLDEEGVALFNWHFESMEQFGFALDALRDYKRTLLIDGNSSQEPRAEGVVELQWFPKRTM